MSVCVSCAILGNGAVGCGAYSAVEEGVGVFLNGVRVAMIHNWGGKSDGQNGQIPYLYKRWTNSLFVMDFLFVLE